VTKSNRMLRVTKWLGTAPAIAVCTACDRQFKVPLTFLHRATEAQANLKFQFDAHKCKAPTRPRA